MLKIAYTVYPEVQLSEQDWMAEFKVGILAPKKDSRAEDIMNTWSENGSPVDWKKFIKRKLVEWS